MSLSAHSLVPQGEQATSCDLILRRRAEPLQPGASALFWLGMEARLTALDALAHIDAGGAKASALVEMMRAPVVGGYAEADVFKACLA